MAILSPRRQFQVLSATVTQFQVRCDGQAPATRLSRRSRNGREIGRIFGLAWRSLCVLSIMLFSGSCIVADPPEYRAPGQTRPVLNTYTAVPTATQALVVDASAGMVPIVNFTVQVRSEDAGESLRAVFFLDYQMKPGTDSNQRGEIPLVVKTIAASTYDNPGRFFTYPWQPMGVKGCHFLTLVVAHESTFQEGDQWNLDPRFAVDDAALVTWTVNVLTSPTDSTTIASCPTREAPSGL